MEEARNVGSGRGTRVDLGCGRRPVRGAFGIDKVALPGVAVVAQLDAAHLPFVDGSLECAFALNTLEHLADLPAAMAEIYRVLCPDGRCIVEVPYFASASAFADPTHRRWFTYTTFEHFAATPTRGWRANRHTWFGSTRFVIARRCLRFGKAHRLAGISWLANRFPTIYENFCAYWFPARALIVELVKRKAAS